MRKLTAFFTALILSLGCLGMVSASADTYEVPNSEHYISYLHSSGEHGILVLPGDSITWTGIGNLGRAEELNLTADQYTIREVHYFDNRYDHTISDDLASIADLTSLEGYLNRNDVIDYPNQSYTVRPLTDFALSPGGTVLSPDDFDFTGWRIKGQKVLDNLQFPPNSKSIKRIGLCLVAQGKCRVTYDPDGGTFDPGTENTTVSADWGEAVTSDPGDFNGKLWREGYRFKKWSDDTDVWRHRTLNAVWEAADDVNVSFFIKDPDTGAYEEVKKRQVKYNGRAESFDPGAKDGHTLNAWYTDKENFNGNTKYGFDKRIREPLKLYGEWIPEKHTVTFDANGGSDVAPQNISYGKKALKPDPAPSKKGYTFEGWFTDKGTLNNEYDFSAPVTADLTLYAGWKKEEAAPEPEPEPVPPPAPSEKIIPFDETGKLQQTAIVGRTESSLGIRWNSIPDADGYFVYFRKCHTYPLKKVAEITDLNNLSFVMNGLKKGTYYKFQLRAYKKVGKKKKIIRKSLISHGVTKGSPKFTMAKGIKILKVTGGTYTSPSGNEAVSGNTLLLKKKEKARIYAEEIPEEEGKEIEKHRGRGKKNPNIQFQSNNPKVASVTKTGKIKAKSPGKCTIFAASQSGMLTAISVTVE